MKAILFALSLVSTVPALAATYDCGGSAELNVVETQWSEPRVDFYPEGQSSSTAGGPKTFSAYFSELQTGKASTANQVAITEVTHLGLVKVYSVVKIDSNILQAGTNVNVVKTQKTVSTFGKKVLASDEKHFHCVLR